MITKFFCESIKDILKIDSNRIFSFFIFKTTMLLLLLISFIPDYSFLFNRYLSSFSLIVSITKLLDKTTTLPLLNMYLVFELSIIVLSFIAEKTTIYLAELKIYLHFLISVQFIFLLVVQISYNSGLSDLNLIELVNYYFTIDSISKLGCSVPFSLNLYSAIVEITSYFYKFE